MGHRCGSPNGFAYSGRHRPYHWHKGRLAVSAAEHRVPGTSAEHSVPSKHKPIVLPSGFLAEVDGLTNLEAFKSSRLADATWCHPKLVVRAAIGMLLMTGTIDVYGLSPDASKVSVTGQADSTQRF